MKYSLDSDLGWRGNVEGRHEVDIDMSLSLADLPDAKDGDAETIRREVFDLVSHVLLPKMLSDAGVDPYDAPLQTRYRSEGENNLSSGGGKIDLRQIINARIEADKDVHPLQALWNSRASIADETANAVVDHLVFVETGEPVNSNRNFKARYGAEGTVLYDSEMAA